MLLWGAFLVGSSMTRTVRVIAFALLLAVSAAGCGGGVEKGKNRDADRPRSAPTKPTSAG